MADPVFSLLVFGSIPMELTLEDHRPQAADARQERFSIRAKFKGTAEDMLLREPFTLEFI